MTARTRVVVLIAAVVALVAAGIAFALSSDGGARESPYAATTGGLCAATDALGRGDSEAARVAFEDEAHQGLHDLAAALDAEHRDVAARLLEAKQRVEAAIERGALSSAELDPLLVASDAGLVALGEPALGCGGER